MASRPILSPHIVINGQSMASSVTSEVTIIQNISGIGYDISWTGTPVGTFDVQVSNSYEQDAAGNLKVTGNWTSIPLDPTPAAAGSAGNGFINLIAMTGFAVRLVYNRTSGSGTLNAEICGKVS